jgi:hypothetical protein
VYSEDVGCLSRIRRFVTQGVRLVLVPALDDAKRVVTSTSWFKQVDCFDDRVSRLSPL